MYVISICFPTSTTQRPVTKGTQAASTSISLQTAHLTSLGAHSCSLYAFSVSVKQELSPTTHVPTASPIPRSTGKAEGTPLRAAAAPGRLSFGTKGLPRCQRFTHFPAPGRPAGPTAATRCLLLLLPPGHCRQPRALAPCPTAASSPALTPTRAGTVEDGTETPAQSPARL